LFDSVYESFDKGNSGEEIFGVIAVSDPNVIFQDANRSSAYIALPPLDGGNKAAMYIPAKATGGGYFISATAPPDRLTAAAALGDALLSDEWTLTLLTDGNYEKADKNAPALGADIAVWKTTVSSLSPPAVLGNGAAPFWYGEELELSKQAQISADGTYHLDTTQNRQGYVNRETVSAYSPYASKYLAYALPEITLSDEQSRRLINGAGDNAENLVAAAIITNARAFITGKRPLTEWNDYVKELEDLGLNTVLEVYNEAYQDTERR